MIRKIFLIVWFLLLIHGLNALNVIEHCWIPLADGTQLAARMWLPDNENESPVPAILEYIPYRKRDGTRCRDESKYYEFAARGYACIRVDLRGSGESDGFLDDEYIKQEQDDALEVINWIATQPWCSGSIGMMGKSWGGFNALQVAARRPSALKAIISVCSTDDRYADDIHYMGGCLLNDNLWWGAIMLAYQARPADAELVGENWYQQWLERIEKMPFWPALWLEHQRRDDYWKHGSICENWNDIVCPVFVIGGWADAYTNAVTRMLEHLQVPRLGLIGPWAHLYPDDGVPGPAIDFIGEACRWWDYWLKGKETGIMSEPMLRVYLEEWRPPSQWCDPVPGRWVQEQTWPSPNIQKRDFYFATRGLVSKKEIESTKLFIKSPLWTGLAVGEWMGSGISADMPFDQRLDDGCSLTFDTEPFIERLELLGAAELVLNIASDKPIAQICARLCDVAPDGSSRRISYQVLNLTHRNSHENPEPLEPGCFYEVFLKLNDCGYAFQPGHQLRVSLSSAYWPLLWPSPEMATLTLNTQACTLTLPVRTPQLEDFVVHFDEPTSKYVCATTKLAEGNMKRYVNFNFLTGKTTYVTDEQSDVVQLDDIKTMLSHNLRRELSIDAYNPLSAHYLLTQKYEMLRPGSNICIESRVTMTSDKTDFFLSGNLNVFENNDHFASKQFRRVIRRDHL